MKILGLKKNEKKRNITLSSFYFFIGYVGSGFFGMESKCILSADLKYNSVFHNTVFKKNKGELNSKLNNRKKEFYILIFKFLIDNSEVFTLYFS